MTDRPILFSAPMVRAILEGRKTVTRRVLKPRPYNRDGDAVDISKAKSARIVTGHDGLDYIQFEHPLGGPLTAHMASYQPGDTLWVREAWRANTEWDGNPPRDIPPGSPVQYEADSPTLTCGGRYRHARFMPRWASRITLNVTGVTVERLQDITEEQAWAEGVSVPSPAHAVRGFRNLWNNINGPDAWDQNPWVAAISFERVTA
jgi:hypothetical protein